MFFSLLMIALAIGHGDHDHDHDHDAHDHDHAHDVGHTCIHDAMQRATTVVVDEQDYGERDHLSKRAQVNTAPLRIFFDTDDLGNGELACTRVGQEVVVSNVRFVCTEADILGQELKNRLRALLAELEAHMKELFNIVRASSPLTLRSSTICGRPLSTTRFMESSTDSVRNNYDMVMKITAWPTEGNVLAWATFCQLDQFGRPIAGHMNFGPAALARRSDPYLYNVMVHELFHALGFHSQRLDKFVTDDGTIYNPIKKVTIGTGAATKDAWFITSERVKKAAREYFNCETMPGFELEDFNENGRPGSHWEKRIAGEEVMSPQAADVKRPAISIFTLAMFHDMGIYFPNYAKAINPAHGLGMGCSFALGAPKNWPAAYQCPRGARGNRCAPSLQGYSSCSWFKYSGDCLPEFSRIDPNDCNAGGNQYADYTSVAGTYESCWDETVIVDETYGESHGANSRCFQADVIKSGWTRPMSAGCYRSRCVASNGAPEPTAAPSAPTTTTTTTRSQQVPTATPSNVQCGAISDCEACTRTPGCGKWCDAGWTASPHKRAGRCTSLSTQCSGTTSVTAASKCYPPCVYNGKAGSCRDAAMCNGQSFASSQGASGCGREPGRVKCCTPLGSKRNVDAIDDVDDVVSARSVEQTSFVGEVEVGGVWLRCPTAGGAARATGGRFGGSIVCPSAEEMCCASKNNCNGRGRCVNGQCQCEQGFSGASCDSTLPGPIQSAPSRANWPRASFANEESQILDRERGDERTKEEYPLDDEFNRVSSMQSSPSAATTSFVDVAIAALAGIVACSF